MLQIKDIMLKSEKLRKSAKNNSVQEFEFAYFKNIDDALVEGLEQNRDFFELLLNNNEIKRNVLGIFAEEVYNSLRNKDKEKVISYPERGEDLVLQAAESREPYGKARTDEDTAT